MLYDCFLNHLVQNAELSFKWHTAISLTQQNELGDLCTILFFFIFKIKLCIMLNCNYLNLSHIINSHTCIIKCNPPPQKKKKKSCCYFYDKGMGLTSVNMFYANVMLFFKYLKFLIELIIIVITCKSPVFPIFVRIVTVCILCNSMQSTFCNNIQIRLLSIVNMWELVRTLISVFRFKIRRLP